MSALRGGRLRARLCALAALAALEALVPVTAHAYPVHRREFQAVYARRAPCLLCHVNGGGTERNSYGVAWHEHGEGERAFRRIERLDSDGDGASNLEEIGADSNPGDARSTPTAAGDTWRRDDSRALVPTAQLELVLEDAERVDVVEADLDAAQERAAAAASGERLGFEDLHPTLYFAVHEGRRTGVALFVGFAGEGGWFSLLVALDVGGRVMRVAVFRAGGDTGSAYILFLRCLQGRGLADMPAPGEGGCPRIAGKEAVQRRLAGAVRRAIAVASVLLSAAPPAQPSSATQPDSGVGAAGVGARRVGARATEPRPAQLDLERPRATLVISTLGPTAVAAFAVGAIALLVLLIAASTRAALSRGVTVSAGARLEALGPSAKLLCGLVVLSLVLVEALAVADVVAQTRLVHGSAAAYFQDLTWQRLLGISHAHVLGYCVLYGLLSLLVCMTSVREWLKCVLVATMFWAGLFDVGSWFAIKALSPRFDWLAIVSGTLAAVASLVSMALVARSLLRRPGHGARSA